MVARETIIQKTSTSLLLESRIVTHWESTVCWLCVLSLELDGLMLKSCIRYMSWNMLPKLLELWSPRLKNESRVIHQPCYSNLEPEFDFSFSIIRPFGLYFQLYILKLSTSLQIFNHCPISM